MFALDAPRPMNPPAKEWYISVIAAPDKKGM